MWFTSDNAAPAAPQIMAALSRANEGNAPSYGGDEIMGRVTARIRELFEAPEAAVYLVATGTAANALSLACLCPPWATIYCHPQSHIEEDECGAPEFYTGGAKLTLVGGDHAMIDPGRLETAIESAAPHGVHNVQPGALSLTNATEAGAVCSPGQVRDLTAIAARHGLPVHMDGARFANALVAAACTPAEMTWKAGIDVLSFGGTKNGLLFGEAVVLFDPARAREFELRRKRAGHLFSKHRYLSAQFEAWLEDGLWIDLARTANDRAARLSAGINNTPGARLLHPADANIIFATWPRALHKAAHAAGAKYELLDPGASLEGPAGDMLAARLVTSWSTTDAEVDDFLAALTA